jgi:hypothetical protein
MYTKRMGGVHDIKASDIQNILRINQVQMVWWSPVVPLFPYLPCPIEHEGLSTSVLCRTTAVSPNAVVCISSLALNVAHGVTRNRIVL